MGSIGKGKRLLGNASGTLNQVVGGWQVAGITAVSSGQWFTPNDSTGFPNSDPFASQFPDQAANPNAKPCQPGTFFNTCAFSDPPLG